MTPKSRTWSALDAACLVGALTAAGFLAAGRTGTLRPRVARPAVTVDQPAGGRAIARVDEASWRRTFAAADLPAPPSLSGLDPVPVGKIAEAVAAWGARREVASLVRLGQLYAALGQMASALPVFAAATALVPEHPAFPYFLGMAAQRLERNAEAVAAFEGARRLEPDYPWTALRLGLLHLERGDAAAAAPFFEELRQREPS